MTFRQKFTSFPWKTCLAVAGLPAALALIISLATAAERASVGYILPRDCYPNGLWKEATGATWRIMDSSYFFTPNLSFGSMTFTQVKVIDVAWDLIIGRGGQLLLAYVNYRVFNEWLVYHMEMHLTSYKMYTAVAFETTSLGTLGVLGKEFLAFGKGTWKRFFRWLALLSMLISTFYVLAFPTLMAAMTGYITTYEAYVEDYDRNLIEWDKVRTVWAIVQDIERVGNSSADYNRPLVVTTDDTELTDALIKCTFSLLILSSLLTDRIPNSTIDMEQNSDSNDYPGPSTSTKAPTTFTYLQNKSTTWEFDSHSVDLPAPSLNITWTTYKSSDPSRGFASEAYGSFPGEFYSLTGDRQGDVYNTSYILSHGSCKPSETYQWGFSYIFLFMVSIFNFVWSCIMVGMWLDTKRGSRMYKAGRRPGLLRSVLDVSTAIREEIGADAEELEEEALRKRLRDSGGALVVPQKELRVARTDSGGLWKRKKGSRWPKASTF